MSELEAALSRSQARCGALQRRCELLQSSAREEAALRAAADEALRRLRTDADRERAARQGAVDEAGVLTAALAARNELIASLQAEVTRLRRDLEDAVNAVAAATSAAHTAALSTLEHVTTTPERLSAGVGSAGSGGVGHVARHSPAAATHRIPTAELGPPRPRRSVVHHVVAAPVGEETPAWRSHAGPAGSAPRGTARHRSPTPLRALPPQAPVAGVGGTEASIAPSGDATATSDASAAYREQARLADAIAETEMLLAESKARMYALASRAFHSRGPASHLTASFLHSVDPDGGGGVCDATTISAATSGAHGDGEITAGDGAGT